MGHPRIAKGRLPIDSLPVKSREDRRGGGAVKAAVMKTEANLRRSGQKILACGKSAEELEIAKPLNMDVRLGIVKRKANPESSFYGQKLSIERLLMYSGEGIVLS